MEKSSPSGSVESAPMNSSEPMPQVPSPALPVAPVRRDNHVRNTSNGRYLKGDRKG